MEIGANESPEKDDLDGDMIENQMYFLLEHLFDLNV
jgi:hypothetical protein